MRSIAKITVAARIATVRALRKLRVGGALMVFPALLPRFGEPSAILVADITCSQPMRTVAATTVRGPSSTTVSAHSPAHLPVTGVERTAVRTARPSLSVRLRALWESRGRMSQTVDRVQATTQPATRSADLPRS